MSTSLLGTSPLASSAPNAAWVARYGSNLGSPRRTLVAFAWPGGGVNAYSSWIPSLPSGTDLIAVAPASRTRDHDGRPASKLDPVLIDSVTETLLTATESSGAVAMFGHSSGALLAHAVAVRLQEHGRTPQTVIVSGSRAPSVKPPHPLHLLSDAELRAKLIVMGAIPRRLQRHERFLRSWLPRVRAEFGAAETYWPGTLGVLDCPLYAWSGLHDWYAPSYSALRWLELSRESAHTTFPGGHFFISRDRSVSHLLQALRWPRPSALQVQPSGRPEPVWRRVS